VTALFGSAALAGLLAETPLTCLDVGARGGLKGDLLPIAFAVDAVGFEPDAEECARLNARIDKGPWRSLSYLPTGLSGGAGRRTLHLTRRRGTSSALVADLAVAARYGRAEYYAPDGEVEFDTLTLDEAVRAHGLARPAFLKIDIEGMELEVFRAAPRTLAGLLGLRVETCFIAGRIGQPLYHELEGFLRGAGFAPMGWLELHHWRRSTRVKHPAAAPGPIPYSRGQLAHGDMLYLRDPETLPDGDAEPLIQAAAIALCYEQVDHAAALLAKPAAAARLAERGIDAARELGIVSRSLLAAWRRTRRRQLWREFKDDVKFRLGRA
jgi:FkbM family methyltransferase